MTNVDDSNWILRLIRETRLTYVKHVELAAAQ